MVSSRRWIVAGCCLLRALVPTGVESQTLSESCAYETCALGVQSPSLLSWLIVEPWVAMGDPAEVVSSLDGTDYFSTVFMATDEMAAYYREFASRDRWADALRHLGLAAMIGGTIAGVATGDGGWPVAVAAVGFSVRLVSEIPARQARRAFTNASDVYNRTLPRSGAARALSWTGHPEAKRRHGRRDRYRRSSTPSPSPRVSM